MLQGHEAYSDDVAYKQSAPYDEHCEPKERASDGGISRSERLKYADHRGSFEDDDEQSRYHGNAGHGNHQRQNNPNVEIEQV